MTNDLIQLAIVVVMAGVLGFFARLLRQPLILAYLATGLLVGYFKFFTIQASLTVFADLGIMFLLFLVGLEISYESFRLVGKAAATVGLAQIVLTFGAGFWLAHLMHFGFLASSYIAIALTFSSTIIVIKLLTEKRDLHSLYGRIAVGVLLVQDFVAILLLVVLSGIQVGQGVVWTSILLVFVKAILLFGLMLWLGRKILPFIFDRVARSQELLFIMSLAWLFLLAALVQKIGFSIEIAGFLAGLSLANSSEHYEIASRIRPLRDFFVLVFFVVLGVTMAASGLHGMLWPAVILSLFVLIGNPLIVLLIMGAMGYRKRTSFMTGVAIAQISEFSLVLVALGSKLGHVSDGVVSLITAVGIITFVASGYLITYGEHIFRRTSRLLQVFERSRPKEDGFFGQEFHKPVVLIGAHRTGQSIAAQLPAEDLLVIDNDPEIIRELQRRKTDHIFGDVADEEVLAKANLGQAKLVISTSPNMEDNMLLLNELNANLPRPKVILRAETEEEAKVLYAQGADYVLLPNFTAGQYLGKTIAVDPEMEILSSLKRKDLDMLRRQHAAYG